MEKIGFVNSNEISTKEITHIFLDWYSKIRKDSFYKEYLWFDVIPYDQRIDYTQFKLKQSKNKRVWHSPKISLMVKYSREDPIQGAVAFRLYLKPVKPLKRKINVAQYLTDEHPEIRAIAASIE